MIKVLWGCDWDPLLANDHDGLLAKRMGEIVDGQYQKYTVESGAYLREHFFGTDPRLLELVKHLSDDQLKKLRLGGHDPVKVYNAYKAAVEHKGQPTVILARTIKGYGLGEAGEGKNITHQQKKLNEADLRTFRTRFGIPISDDEIADAPFYRPPDDSPELQYLRERRKALGGFMPSRTVTSRRSTRRSTRSSRSSRQGTEGRKASTTMVFVRILAKLLRDKEIGDLIVPIVPDEARTFGMEALFRQVGIYSHVGQKYEPVDMDTLLYYKEAQDGQILEEGITEAGSMSSFIAAGTAYATYGINTIPFFIFYSMFGFQRVARPDLGRRRLAHARLPARRDRGADDAARARGCSTRTATATCSRCRCPNCVSYDPAFAYELAVIIQEGIRRMYTNQESVFYYLTVMNEQYEMPPMPEGSREGILKGMYRFTPGDQREGQAEGAAAGKRRDPERGHHRAEAAREIQRRRRRVERHELSGALSRCARRRALEHAAPDGDAAGAVRDTVPQGHARRDRGGIRLPEGAAGFARSLDAAARAVARHRWFRPQRRSRRAARVLRSRRAVHRRRHAGRARAGRADRSRRRGAGDQGLRHQPRQGRIRRRVSRGSGLEIRAQDSSVRSW